MKWITATSVTVSTITKCWNISSQYGAHLGTVKWYAAWRRYAFFPAIETVFEADCLHDLANFCADQTQERKRERAAEKEIA